MKRMSPADLCEKACEHESRLEKVEGSEKSNKRKSLSAILLALALALKELYLYAQQAGYL